MAAPQFSSEQEFREVMDRIFTMMSEDPGMGPQLRAADVPQRFEFSDLDLVVNVRAAHDGEEGNLHWECSDDAPWFAQVRMTMSSETANRYFQGKENVALRSPGGASRRGRREGCAGPHPDHQAHLRALPRDGRGAVPAPRRLRPDTKLLTVDPHRARPQGTNPASAPDARVAHRLDTRATLAGGGAPTQVRPPLS